MLCLLLPPPFKPSPQSQPDVECFPLPDWQSAALSSAGWVSVTDDIFPECAGFITSPDESFLLEQKDIYWSRLWPPSRGCFDAVLVIDKEHSSSCSTERSRSQAMQNISSPRIFGSVSASTWPKYSPSAVIQSGLCCWSCCCLWLAPFLASFSLLFSKQTNHHKKIASSLLSAGNTLPGLSLLAVIFLFY